MFTIQTYIPTIQLCMHLLFTLWWSREILLQQPKPLLAANSHQVVPWLLQPNFKIFIQFTNG